MGIGMGDEMITGPQALVFFLVFLPVAVAVAVSIELVRKSQKRILAARCVGAVVAISFSFFFAWLGWDEIGPFMSVFHARLFLVGWTLAVMALAIAYALVPLWHLIRAWLVGLHLLLIGLLLGLTIGTINWAAWTASDSTQIWLAFWVLLLTVAQTRRIVAAKPVSSSKLQRLESQALLRRKQA